MPSYKIVHFDASVLAAEGGPAVANKIQSIVAEHAGQGWGFVGVQQAESLMTNPGSNGCLGIGATPTTRSSVSVNLLVFSHE